MNPLDAATMRRCQVSGDEGRTRGLNVYNDNDCSAGTCADRENNTK